jgi:hypothetical protein
VPGNHTHHFGHGGVDPYSSLALSPADRNALLASPLGWSLRVGWRLGPSPGSIESLLLAA